MNIERLGLLFDPKLHCPKGFTHASNPFVLNLSEEKIRVVFNSRDEKNCSHVFSAEYKFDGKSFQISSEVKWLMGPGEIGAFDDSGVSVGGIFKVRDEYYLYYMGWNLGVTVPWRNTIGIAKYDVQNNMIERWKRVPLLDRSEEDPFTLSYPWVFKKTDEYFIYYGSNKRWDTTKVDIDHVLKWGTSKDGMHWNMHGQLSFKAPENANAFCRPSLLEKNGEFLFAFAFRSEKYKIGFLTSEDLQNWKFTGTFGPLTNSLWESEEVTYPSFFHIRGRDFFLYCGNGYGKTGFGIAEIK